MSEWKGEAIYGVDGRHMKEFYLRTRDDQSLNPEGLRKKCVSMGMDTSNLVFHHCDLGLTNILVDTATRGIGIVDWEISGYVPREWIRSKFHLSSGMDISDRGRRFEVRLAVPGCTEVGRDGFPRGD
jgi:hypothetical protein